jgi:hypothetical protein
MDVDWMMWMKAVVRGEDACVRRVGTPAMPRHVTGLNSHIWGLHSLDSLYWTTHVRFHGGMRCPGPTWQPDDLPTPVGFMALTRCARGVQSSVSLAATESVEEVKDSYFSNPTFRSSMDDPDNEINRHQCQQEPLRIRRSLRDVQYTGIMTMQEDDELFAYA